MHHYLARSLNFLQAVERDVIQVAGRVEVSLFVSHYLIKEVVFSSFSLLPF
jgi:hypothetical protein